MIAVTHLVKTYRGRDHEIQALRGVSLKVKAGEVFGIIGKSGAGKSTLIRCLNMLEKPTSGSVMLGGQELTTLDDRNLRGVRQKIGMIFQHFNLLASRTVFANIAFPLELAGWSQKKIHTRVETLLQLVGLEDKREQYPAKLSGGQKQRVGIARALANEPQVLLCDEATSALDPQTTRSILQLLRDINRQLHLTIVLITHEMQVIKEICDQVAVLEAGVIIEQGSVLEVFTRPQTATARDFIGSVMQQCLPEFFRQTVFSVTPLPESRLVLAISFVGDLTEEPFITGVIRRFQVDVDILQGNIDHIQGVAFGRLLIGLSGEQADVGAALVYIRAQNLTVEVMGYAERHPTVVT